MAQEPGQQNENKEVKDEKTQASTAQGTQPQRSTGQRSTGQRSTGGQRYTGQRSTGQRSTGQRSTGTGGQRYTGQRSGGGSFRGRQQQRPGQRPFQRRRYHRRKVCLFCADKSKEINWKRPENLRRFIGDNGSMYPRRKSGMCAKHQRRVAIAIKRARHIALFPYTTEHIRIMGKS